MQPLQILLQRKYFLFSAFLMMTVLMLGTIAALVIASYWLNSMKGIIHTPNSHYDYIVVGAGTAGCVLTSRLSSSIKKPSVLVIEAGGYFPWWSSLPLVAPLLQKTSYDWTYHTVPQLYSSWGLNNEVSAWPRGRGLGGSSQMNYMIHFSGTEKDLRRWEEMGVEDWNYEKIQLAMNSVFGLEREKNSFAKTYTCINNYTFLLSSAVHKTCQKKSYKKACNYNNPRLHVSSVCPELSILVRAFLTASNEIKQTNNESVFFAPALSYVKEGHRWSGFDGFLKPVLGKHNLHVLIHAIVSKILVSDKGRARGIEIILSNNKKIKIYSKKEIILSAGSINTPQILLLSGIGPREHLEEIGIPLLKDLPVGLGLHDHLNLPLYVSIKEPVSITMDKVLQISQLLRYLVFREGYLSSTGIVGVGAASPNTGIVLFGLGSVDEKLLRKVANYKHSVFKSLFPLTQNTSQEGFVLLTSCLQPLSRGSISLQSQDPTQQPMIDPLYLSQRSDIVCMTEAIRLAARLIETKPFQELGAQLHLPLFDECKHTIPHLQDDAYLECVLRTAAITGYHPAGTCKMGKSTDPTTVVDSYLRVHGIQGLRIADASVMPTPISGHPNSMVAAIAERASSFILNT